MRACRRAGTSGDPQARVVRVDDKSEVGDRIDHRLGLARVYARDQERPPWRQPKTICAKRPSTLDQRPESTRLEFAKGRRCANNDLCAVCVRAEDVA
jgi:hypothetical protein